MATKILAKSKKWHLRKWLPKFGRQMNRPKGSSLCPVVWFWQGYDLMGVLSASHPALTEEIVLPFIQWLGFLFGSLALARHAHCSHKCSSFGWKHFGPFIGVVVVSIEVSAGLATITIYGFHFCQSWYSQVDSNLRGYFCLVTSTHPPLSFL